MRRTILLLLASLMLGAAGHAPAQEAPPVRVFDAGELSLDRYTVLRRLWTQTWRASFHYPVHADAGGAIGALTSEAARLGADGVINLHCLSDTGGWRGGYYCYGLAIKLK